MKDCKSRMTIQRAVLIVIGCGFASFAFAQDESQCADPWHDLLMICDLPGGCSKGSLIKYGMDDRCRDQVKEEIVLSPEELKFYHELVISRLMEEQQAILFELPSTCNDASYECLRDPMRKDCVNIRLCHRDITVTERQAPDDFDTIRNRLLKGLYYQEAAQHQPAPIILIAAPFLFNCLVIGVGHLARRKSTQGKSISVTLARGTLTLSAAILGMAVVALVVMNRPELELMRQTLVGFVPAFALAVLGILWLRPQHEGESKDESLENP